MKKLAITLLLTLAAAACGSNPQLAGSGGKINRTPLDAAAQATWKQAVADGDAAWANRGDEAQLRAAIAAWEKAVAVKADDAGTPQKLARADYPPAGGFLFFHA